VAGVVNVRGALVPVVDVRGALGIPPQRARLSDVLIVLERSSEFAAIIVSEVRDVRPLSARAIENGPMKMASGHGLVAGLATVGDEIVQMLRLETVLHLGEVSEASDPALRDLSGFAAEGAFTPARGLFEGVPTDELDLFAARTRALGRNPNAEIEVRTAQTRLVAAFSLGGEFFGLDLNVVREFSPLKAVSPVPCSPPYIAGLMNLRGETLTLIDIGPTLGLASTGIKMESGKVVVTQCEGLRLGILVDEVLDIITVDTAQITAAASHSVAKSDGEMVRGAVFFRDKMLGIIDLPRLLGSDALGAGR
ncbi:hypothetical protein EON80_23855, partial [bacterium]